MKDVDVARLVLAWAREHGAVDLVTFCASVRGWGCELPRFESDVAKGNALALARSFAWSAEEIYLAFNPSSEEARK